MDQDLNIEYNPQFSIEGVKFRFYSAAEIKALSVKQITNVETFDSLGHANTGGLYDPALGTCERYDACFTCGLYTQQCPGHMGHIELAVPLFNTIVFPTLFHLLKAVCFNCHRLSIEQSAIDLFLEQCKLLDEGFVAEASELQGVFAETDKTENQDKINEIKAFTENVFNDRRNGTIKMIPVKNVEAVKQEILKSFMKKHVKHHNKCIHCVVHLPKLRMEYNAKIFVVGGKSVASKRSNKNSIRDDEDNDEEDDDFDESEGQPKKKKQKLQTVKDNSSKTGEVMLLTPINIRETLRKVWTLEKELLTRMYPSLLSADVEYPTDLFFVDVVAVPPTKFRPISFMRGKKFEHAQTSNLLRVLKCNYIVREIQWEMEKVSANTQLEGKAKYSRDVNQIPGKTLVDKLSNALTKLQTYANAVIDSELDKQSDDVNPGIKQVIEKKEGIFRKNMMGKRVNFAARSVISPDPNINTNEIGIPEVFAKVLSYPQPVTPWNVHELRQAVINGPDIHPGATHVEDENGHKTRLDSRFPLKREALAKQLLTPTTVKDKNPGGVKKVFRHLKNGDVLLINRQPTLHRPSIQAHKARVCKGEKTLRLHYANCKAYNADFDGDEMNAHFPQNEIARSEAYNLASTDFQYLVPKDGTPLAGLIQDHMVSGVSLTIRGRFFTKEEYCRLVYGALVDKKGPVKMLPPVIIKPVKLWSGKQVLSTVVLNVIPDDRPALSLDGKAKVPEKSWVKIQKVKMNDPLKYMTESEDVIIRQGELLCGVLDKGHYGPSNFGLIHCCYELYGGAVAGLMLTCFGRLFTNFLQWRGFTLGVEDILVTRHGDRKRKKLIRRSPSCGGMSAKKALELDPACDDEELTNALKNAHFSKDQRQMRELDMNMRNETNTIQNDIVNACMPNGLEKLFPDNNLQLMVQSGAKGSMVNCMQISCLLGQIELEGKRPPLMLSGKTLPSFLSYDVTPRAGGFVTGRFLTGIRQQEYFFHCMAGREGLVDTAVKTSRSGYLQRCLIKHLEGIKVNYDLTVRDCDSSVIQFKYGEDSLDISKVGFLIPKQFPFLMSNKHILQNKQQKPPSDKSDERTIGKLEKKIHKWQKKNKCEGARSMRKSGFLQFCQDVGDEVHVKEDSDTVSGRSEKDWQLCTLWNDLNEEERKIYEKNCGRCPDPVLSTFLPYSPNVLPEKLGDIIKNYAKKNTNEKQFHKLMNLKVQQSVIEPGEAVGLLCAQSIGEPSTQMTLNTFHFAGRGEMNVTLGIPRLREILMVGSKNIKTPALDIPVLPGNDVLENVKKLQRRLTKVNLDEVIQNIQVCEWLAIKGKIRVQRRRVFRIRLNFLPRECYKERFIVVPNQILKFVEKTYIKKIVQLIRAKINARHKLLNSGTWKPRFLYRNVQESESSNVGANVDDDDDDDDEVEVMDADDGDETSTNQKQKKMEEHEYGNEDENSRDSFDKENEEDYVEMEDEIPETEDINEELIDEYEEKEKEKDNPEARINSVLQLAPEVEHYRYDMRKKLWCEVTISFPLQNSKIDLLALLESDIKKHIVYEVPGISRCILGEQDGPHGKEMHLKTEGINMHELYRNADILDINRLYCNSIHDMAVTYGIEAASRVVIKEVQAVFAAYGINVDYRHLSLLADYMTFEGSYKPFNRVAMETNPSPLQKMSFEQTMKFLVDSSVKCRTDSLKSPSAQIVLGKNVSCGTGCIDLFTPLTF